MREHQMGLDRIRLQGPTCPERVASAPLSIGGIGANPGFADFAGVAGWTGRQCPAVLMSLPSQSFQELDCQ